MRSRVVIRLMLVIAVFCALPVAAENQRALNCAFDAGYEGEDFAEFFSKSKEVSSVFCRQYIQYLKDRRNFNGSEIQLTLVTYSEQARLALGARVDSSREAFKSQFSELTNTFSLFDFGDVRLPQFIVEPALARGQGDKAYFTSLLDEDIERINIGPDDSCTSTIPGRSCTEIYKDFRDAFNPYRTTYDRLYDNTLLLGHLASRWDEFLELSKSQTALEVVLTTYWHGDHFKENHLVGPPKSQVIALHPRLIFAYIDKAADGSNTDIGLALEWLGLNYWDLKIPFGFSLTSVYMDRLDMDDVGHGVMLHFYNYYSIGWSDHGDKDALYVSLDLLKLFQNNRRRYESFINSYF